MFKGLITWIVLGATMTATYAEYDGHFMGVDGEASSKPACPPPPARRYDITDMGYEYMFRGWVDVQGSGAANDYCRFVGDAPNVHLACALAGTIGESEANYVSETTGFDRGYPDTWYMKDEDDDGRDDYCRCIGAADKPEVQEVMCTKAGPNGFYGSDAQGGDAYTFSPLGKIACANRKVTPEFGRP